MARNDPLVPMDPEFGMPDGTDIDPLNYADKVYNPAFTSDEIGPNRAIPKGFVQEQKHGEPYCNYDGYEAGNTTLVQLDEYKVIRNTVLVTPIVYAEDCQTIDGMNGSERI